MRSDRRPAERYSLTFTAASLRPELARIVAEAYLECGDWQETRRRVLASNALQARTSSSGVRMEREMRQRIQTLSSDQIEILANGSADSRGAIAWLAVLKSNGFVFAFASETLRDKIEAHDPVLRPSDYEGFIASESAAHPELLSLTAITKAKIRQVLVKMLREADILGQDRKDFGLQRPLLPPDVLSAIVAEDRRWLAGFLIPDNELAMLGA
jgi:hypothetical protein